MASYVWIGTTSAAFGTSTNWSPNGTPTTGDTIVFDGRATRDLDGSNQSAITLASMQVYDNFGYAIGSTAASLRIGATECRIGIPSPSGTGGQGPTRVVLDFGSVQTTCAVYSSGTGGDTGGLETILLAGTNASNALEVFGGNVGVGRASPAQASTFASINVVAGELTLGSNCTLTNVTVIGGNLLTESRVPTTLKISGGVVTTTGTWAGPIGTTDLLGGSLFANHRASGDDLTTVNLLGGTLSLTGNTTAFTINALNLRAGTINVFSSGQLTATAVTLDLEPGSYNLTHSSQA